MKLLTALALGLLMVGCAPSANDSSTASSAQTDSTSTSAKQDTNLASAVPPPSQPPVESPDPDKRNPKKGDEVAVIDTNLGKIVLMFFKDKAPNHVANFIKLAKKGFYDGTKFHRVIPGFMIQGGDPNTKKADRSLYGQGGPGYNINGEMNDMPHKRGVLSMARTGDPNGAGSQFFIVVKDSMFLNPVLDSSGHPEPGREGYTVFGRCIQGMDVVDKIVNLKRDENDDPLPQNPAIVKSVKIKKWPIK
jgi:peptidyl-prolyl cis-trans isomerase B (cyclophilin B)